MKTDLTSIVGSGCITDDPDTLLQYSKDYSFVQPRRPGCVVYAETVDQIRNVVKYANDHKIPVTPRSSSIGFYGAGIPSEGGIVLDLTRMDVIGPAFANCHILIGKIKEALDPNYLANPTRVVDIEQMKKKGEL